MHVREARSQCREGTTHDVIHSAGLLAGDRKEVIFPGASMRLQPPLREGVRTWLLLLKDHSRSYVGNSRMESKPGRKTQGPNGWQWSADLKRRRF